MVALDEAIQTLADEGLRGRVKPDHGEMFDAFTPRSEGL
jgi:hypothetical protein